MIRIAMLLRGPQRELRSVRQDIHDLFGPAYSEEHASRDMGVRLSEADLAADGGARRRRVVQASVFLRNTAAERAP